MNDSEKSNSPVTLRIVTPGNEHTEIACDSVHLIAKDGTDKNGGGSLGIRRHHAPALIALQDGKIGAYLNGKEIFSLDITGGIASVSEDIVTVFPE